jgi:hypothetical protein
MDWIEERAHQIALAMVSTSLEMSGARMIDAWKAQIASELRAAERRGIESAVECVKAAYPREQAEEIEEVINNALAAPPADATGG